MRKTERLKVIVSETNLKKTFPKKDLNPEISSKWPLTKFKFSQNDTTWCAIYEWRNWNNPNSKHILPQVGKVKVYLKSKIIVYIFTSAVCLSNENYKIGPQPKCTWAQVHYGSPN